MTPKRKPRRRMVYSFTFGFHDGAVIAVGPQQKPSEKKIRSEGLIVDEDGVFQENYYSPTYWTKWDDEHRVKTVGILANRLNTRRAIRELVLPELNQLKAMLTDIQNRLHTLENELVSDDQRQSHS